ncbi:transcriptional regulator [Salmonella enterica subsp. enterica serovar Kingston]|nr:transcriptional regulator [Salmonella enterica subsp. enterica serovar Agama]EBW9747788.1 transcriptional regulator [Salmonella enterica subsp. enterica serovar Kingston]ECD8387949.1 transcriptional regulator [Salmonella enterica subsp. enterica serovar Stockholm]
MPPRKNSWLPHCHFDNLQCHIDSIIYSLFDYTKNKKPI